MKRTLLAILLALTFSATAYAHNRAQVIQLGLQSIVKLTQGDDPNHMALCTGFVINQKRGLVLTARHCIDGEGTLRLNGAEVKVVKKNEALALLQTQMTLGPTLFIRKPELNLGDEVIPIGWGFGTFTPLVRHIADPHLRADPSSKVQDDIVMDGPLVPGMSGGPVLDEDGNVVGVNQQNSPNYLLSLACGPNEIRDFLKGA